MLGHRTAPHRIPPNLLGSHLAYHFYKCSFARYHIINIQYNMAVASMRKRTRTLSPSYRGDKGFEFENQSAFARGQSGISGRGGGVGMGSEPDI